MYLDKFGRLSDYMTKKAAKRKKIFDPKKGVRYKNRDLTPETDRHFEAKRRFYALRNATLGSFAGAALGAMSGRDPGKGFIYGYLAGGAGGYLHYPYTYGGEKKASVDRDLLLEADRDPGIAGFVRPDSGATRVPFKHKGKVVGFMTPRQDPDGYHRVGAVYVKPEYRGKGIAARNIASYMEGKKSKVWIEDDNIATARAHTKAGYKKGRRAAKDAHWYVKEAAKRRMYHGSRYKFDEFKPKGHKLSKNRPVVFGTPLRAMAVAGMGRKWTDDDFEQATYNDEDLLHMRERKPGALERVYKGQRGYLYEVDPDSFEHGGDAYMPTEFVSYVPPKILKRDEVDAYEAMLEEERAGRMKIHRMKKQAAKRKKAVIIKGNPYYLEQGPDTAGYAAYYKDIENELRSAGYDDVIYDRGEPMTLPPPADLWVGHSRGASRLRFAPKGTKTLNITEYEDGINEYKTRLLKEMRKRGYSSVREFPVEERPRPGREHFTLTQRGRDALRKQASAPRDYKREYRLFHSSPEAKRNRAKRNLWNRRLKGKVPAGYEIDHRRQLRYGGGNGRDNIRFMRISKNRAEHNRGRVVRDHMRKESSAYLATQPILGTDRVYSWAEQMEKVAKSRGIKFVEKLFKQGKDKEALKALSDIERSAAGTRSRAVAKAVAKRELSRAPESLVMARKILANDKASAAARRRAQIIVDRHASSLASGEGSIAQREIKGLTDKTLGRGEQGVVEPAFSGGRAAVRKRVSRKANQGDVQRLQSEAADSVEISNLIKQDADLNKLVRTPEFLAAGNVQTGIVGQGRKTVEARISALRNKASDVTKLPKADRAELKRLEGIEARFKRRDRLQELGKRENERGFFNRNKLKRGERRELKALREAQGRGELSVSKYTRGQSMPMERVDLTGGNIGVAEQQMQNLRVAKARNIMETKYNLDMLDHNPGAINSNMAFSATGKPVMYDFGIVGDASQGTFRSRITQNPTKRFADIQNNTFKYLDEANKYTPSQLAPGAAPLPTNTPPLPNLPTVKPLPKLNPVATGGTTTATGGTTAATGGASAPKNLTPMVMGGGAVLGAGVGAAQSNEGNRLGGALGGAMLGTALGAGASTGFQMMSKAASVAIKRDPAKWEAAKREAKAKMGGKHSARAMQLATQIYKKKGGTYAGKKPSPSKNKLRKWTKQKWQWSGGDKPGQGGKGVYLPKKSKEQLASNKAGRAKLRAAARVKREATARGQQFSSHGLHIGKKRSDTA